MNKAVVGVINTNKYLYKDILTLERVQCSFTRVILGTNGINEEERFRNISCNLAK